MFRKKNIYIYIYKLEVVFDKQMGLDYLLVTSFLKISPQELTHSIVTTGSNTAL